MDEDEMVVIIVGENSNEEETPMTFPIKTEVMEEPDVHDIMNTVIKHGQFLSVKEEYNDEETIDEYHELDEAFFSADKLEEILMANNQCKSEDNEECSLPMKEDFLDSNSDDDYLPKDSDESNSDSDTEVHVPVRRKFVTAAQRKSFVEDLKQQYRELRFNKKALVETLAEIMRNVRRPDPPRDFFYVNGIMFECRKCGAMSETSPAAARHYQDKHGPRYLVCYACGVDFRCTTNLYKHEKRCQAPDIVTVLKARAMCLGRKGRGRPFLPDPADAVTRERIQKGLVYACTQCSAMFSCRTNLEAHENVHKGLRPYRCRECPNAYTSYPPLKRHVKTQHLGDEYICDHCGRAFKAKGSLVVHLNTHAPVRKYGCPHCDKRYASNAALQHHVRSMHLNLPPRCKCPLCPKGYNRMSLVRDHMKRVHGMSLMTRTMLFKALPKLTDQQLQQAKAIIAVSNDENDFPVRRPEAVSAATGKKRSKAFNKTVA